MAMSYTSYCWVVGTTSFRTRQLNRMIELQLRYLDEFWSDPRFAGQAWTGNNCLQAAYYSFLKDRGFLDGDAPKPDKDAREKILGLRNLGLVDDKRRITAAGQKVLSISREGDFGIDASNRLDLPKDSYQYFLQLLKTSKLIKEGWRVPLVVRPFVILLHVLNKISPSTDRGKFLSMDEFTFLLPMCINEETTKDIVDKISESRRSGRPLDINATILAALMKMDNYREALRKFKSAKVVDEDLICLVGMNRKSGATGNKHYDAPYLGIFDTLHDLAFKGLSQTRLERLVQAIDLCKQKKVWQKHFFDIAPGGRLPASLMSALRRDLDILSANDEDKFRCEFFKTMHLLKAKSTLKDYADLNRRYFRLSDVLVFDDDVVRLDPLPRAFADKIGGWLETEAFCACDCLEQDVSLEQIVAIPLPQKEELVVAATGRSLESIKEGGGVKEVLKADRSARFSAMLHEKFPLATIKKLLELLEDRSQSHDAEVQKLVTDNANVPTIFEYIVGLAWHYVSGETGDVLEYMNLSLGPDFLPKTHAGGGEADIVWQYADNPPHYKRHALLIEATLAEKDSQRRMEMEPVSRHLGQFLLSHPGDRSSYCAFVTTYLDLNVISDFRGKKHQTFYNPSDRTKHVDGMKIVPIDTKMLREILERGLQYPSLYRTFDDFHNREGDPLACHDDLRATIES